MKFPVLIQQAREQMEELEEERRREKEKQRREDTREEEELEEERRREKEKQRREDTREPAQQRSVPVPAKHESKGGDLPVGKEYAAFISHKKVCSVFVKRPILSVFFFFHAKDTQ